VKRTAGAGVNASASKEYGKMRVMVTFRFPTESGNDALKDGRIGKLLPKILEDLKPEAAYFYSTQGMRAGHFVVNMDDSTQVLDIGERLWFGLRGEVEMTPVMSAEDIQKAMPRIGGIIETYG
jgi:hypothetical protein